MDPRGAVRPLGTAAARVRAFLDTNVLVYSIDHSDPVKHDIAREVLASRADELVVSAQVLSELYAVITRKLSASVTPEQAASFVDRISGLLVVAIDADLVREAIAVSRQSQLSYWDGLILAAARLARCDVLLTEDLAHGATLSASVSRTRSSGEATPACARPYGVPGASLVSWRGLPSGWARR